MIAMTLSARAATVLVGPRRLERLLRPFHQCRAERHRADRAVPWRGQDAGQHRVRPDPAGARHRSADRQSVLRLARVAARPTNGRDDVTALPYGPKRPAHVHRRLRRHAADLAEDARPDPGLGSGTGLGIHHRLHHPARRVRRADGAQIHAARRDARRTRRNLDRLHLDAPGVSELAGAVAVVHFARDHPGQLDRARAAAVRHPGRPCRGAGRHGAGVDRDAHRYQPRHGPACGRRGAGEIRPASADPGGAFPARA